MSAKMMSLKRLSGKCILIMTAFLFFMNYAEAIPEKQSKWIKDGDECTVSFDEKEQMTMNQQTGITVQNSKITIRLKKQFQEPMMGKTKEGMYDRIQIDQLEQWDGAPGAPITPFKTIKMVIPYNQRVTKIRIKLGENYEIPGIYKLEPAAEPVPLSMMDKAKPAQPDPVIYESDSVYPNIPCGDVNIQTKQGYKILFINLFPIEYYPKSGKIKYYPQMEAEIETSPLSNAGGIQNKEQCPALKSDPKIKGEIRNLIDNPETLDTYPTVDQGSMISQGTSMATTATTGTHEYLIITTKALKNATGTYTFNNLIDAKIARGVTVKIASVEDDIYPFYSGIRPDGTIDNQTKIRNFIIDYYTKYGTKYVLLGGDNDLIPARRFRVTGGPYTYNMPVDMYYGCLDGTFDNDADGIYGESNDGVNAGEVDLMAEVYIGRAAVSNAAEIANFVKKTLAYESTNAGYPYSNYMVGEYLGFGGVSDYATSSMEEIRLGSDTHEYTTIGFENSGDAYYSAVNTLYDKAGYRWSQDEIINIMNSGVQMLNHYGHASDRYDMKLYTSDLTRLTNANYFFAYSQGCYPGAFDTFECFAEVITTMEKGAFAVVMNARYGWGAGFSTAGPSQYYDREFWDAIFREGISNLGKMNQDSKEDNIARINGECMRWCYYELNLFGDPELSLKRGEKIKISISSPGQNSFIRGQTQISGSAFMEENFQKYELFYAPVDDPANKTLITSSSVPIQDGFLGVLDTSYLPDKMYLILLKVVSAQGREIVRSNEVIVDNINEPPVFKPLNNKCAVINRLLEFKVEASDPDDPLTSQGLTYSAEQLPAGAQFESATQIFSWQPQESDKGIYYEVVFTVSDNEHTVNQKVILSTVVMQETQVTINPSDEYDPAIYGDKIVWEDRRNGNGDIYLYDLSTQQETQITANTYSQCRPAIYGYKIVWDDYRNGNWDIYMYDISTQQETQITTNPSIQNGCAIYKDKIVWDDYRNRNWNIYMYDLSTQQETQITTNTYSQCFPAIYGDKIVWEDNRNGNENCDIYLYDISTQQETRITTNPFDQYGPAIYKDKIVWTGCRNGDNGYDIYLYDISTQQETQITTTSSAGPRDHAIYEDKIVWTDYRNGNGDIYLYDISTKQETEIATNHFHQCFPAIYGNKIVWLDNRNGNLDICMAKYYFAPQIASISPVISKVGDTITIKGKNFGYVQEEGKVEFSNGVNAAVKTWKNTEIIYSIPSGALSGLMRVITPGGTSNGIEVTIATDPTPPTTTASGIDGLWHRDPVKVTLTATDTGGSGVDKIYYAYSVDGNAPVTNVYTVPFTISVEGQFIVKYYAVDKAGNKEQVKTAANLVKVDRTPPTTPVVKDEGLCISNKTALSASWASSDATSGIVQYCYKIRQDSPKGPAITPNWISTGTINSATAIGLNLIVGKTYYFEVQAKNGAGGWSKSGFSDGIMVVSSDNLARNSNMEQGVNAPLSWGTNSNNELTSITGWATDAAHSPTHSLKIMNSRGVNAYWSGGGINFTAPYPKKVELGGWSKAKDVKLGTRGLYCLDFRIEFEDGSIQWYYPAGLKFSPGTHGWENRSVTYAPSKGIKSIEPYCLVYYGATGTAWFDDIYVYRLD